MSVNDDIFDDVGQKIAHAVRLVQQVAEAKRWRDQRVLASEQEAARSAQYRMQTAVSTARPYLSEGLRDRWWKEAELEDAVHMLGVAERFAGADPMAEAVQTRARREIKERWDIDITERDWRDALAAPDEEIADADKMTLVDGEKPDPPDELREQIALRQADLDSEEVISSLEANTSLPVQTREKLIARLREASASQAGRDAQGQADEVLARAQADRDAAVARQDEADTRVADGDPTAQSEAVTARTARSRAEDTLAAARARAERARTGDPEADAGIEAREVSFPAPAGRARTGKTTKNKTHSARAKTYQTEKKAGKGR
mgnify:CR=1 FL=1